MYHYGQIVLVAEVLDPQGRNPKSRPIVIVTPDVEISQGGDLWGVAVTGTFPEPLPDDAVRLPWHREGHPKTGLDKPAVAACRWLIRIEPGLILKSKGFVPGKQIREIAGILSHLADDRSSG